jgi:hypothetical protein
MIAASPASVIIQPQLKSTFRRGEDMPGKCLMSSWLAPAPAISQNQGALRP